MIKKDWAYGVIRYTTAIFGLYALANGIYMLAGGPPEAFAPFFPFPASPRPFNWFGAVTLVLGISTVVGALNLKEAWAFRLMVASISAQVILWLYDAVMLSLVLAPDEADQDLVMLVIMLGLLVANASLPGIGKPSD